MTTPECIAFEGLAGDWSYEVVGFRCPEQGEYYLLLAYQLSDFETIMTAICYSVVRIVMDEFEPSDQKIALKNLYGAMKEGLKVG